MSKRYDVVAVTGKYTDKNGQEKSRYLNIGAVLQTKNGFALKLEAVPTGWDGWAYLNEPKTDEKPAPKPRPTQGHGFEDMDDDIPL